MVYEDKVIDLCGSSSDDNSPCPLPPKVQGSLGPSSRAKSKSLSTARNTIYLWSSEEEDESLEGSIVDLTTTTKKNRDEFEDSEEEDFETAMKGVVSRCEEERIKPKKKRKRSLQKVKS